MTRTGLREAELWIGEMRGIMLGDCPVLLVRHEGGMSAFHDRCPHQGYPLSEGELQGGVITCRAHQHRFDAASGAGVNPVRPCLVRLPVLVSDGEIVVEAEPRRAAP